MTNFRAAIIGTGGIARAHVTAIKEASDRVDLVAGVDVSPENLDRFCTEHGITHQYTDVQKMLDEQKPNLVHICTPPSTHAELCIQALRNGAHVICEKPLVSTLKEVDDIQAAEKESGLTCSTIFQWRFGSASAHFRKLIDSGELGAPMIGLCNTTWYRNHAYYEVPWRGKWDTELGGVSMGHGIHAMDFFMWMMGDWEELNAMMKTLDRNVEIETLSMAQVRFTSGALGSIVNSVLSPREVSYLRFDFQKATVELEHLYRHTNDDWTFSVPNNQGLESDLERWQKIDGDVQSNRGAQLKQTLDDIEAGRAPLTSGVQARNTVEFITSLYKSGLTHQTVKKGEITADDPFYYHVYGAEKPTRVE